MNAHGESRLHRISSVGVRQGTHGKSAEGLVVAEWLRRACVRVMCWFVQACGPGVSLGE